MKILKIIVAALALSACADSTRYLESPNGAGLPAHSSFYVAVPEDGYYGAKRYVGSGTMTSNVIRNALQNNGQRATRASGVETFEAALARARAGGFAYLVYPTIQHWEDRATEWNFMRDKVAVRIEVVDVFSGQADRSTLIEGKSGIATLGGDHPQDLLPEPINAYFASLFAPVFP